MITSDAFRGKRYAVLGLARSGAATVEALLASGASVTAWDADVGRREALADGVQDLSNRLDAVELAFADPLTIDVAGFDGVVVSPGVPLNTHPIAAHARAAGVPVIGDIELFAHARASLPPHKVVGITGTNGKSTTTALVHHILREAGVPVLMGGNIGLPIMGQEPLPAGGVYVLELSSFQIDLTSTLDCDVAVLLNITPDHLDRYESFEAYAASKMRLLEMQSNENFSIVRLGDTLEFCSAELGEPSTFEFIEDVLQFLRPQLIKQQADWPSLQGPHNLLNVGAAVQACAVLGLADDQIKASLRTYPGLPHRMERVGERNGVLYVNDSKATNPTSTAPALDAFTGIHWILGGKPKSDELGELLDHLSGVVAAYTIGAAGEGYARQLDGRVPVTRSDTLDRAVADAAATAKPGEVVLLSPACASFDQFSDFEARGRAFIDAVGRIA